MENQFTLDELIYLREALDTYYESYEEDLEKAYANGDDDVKEISDEKKKVRKLINKVIDLITEQL